MFTECNLKETIKKVIIEKLNDVIVSTGMVTIVSDASGVVKTKNFTPVNLEGTWDIDNFGNIITGLTAKSGYKLDTTQHNVLYDIITLNVTKCPKEVIEVQNQFGYRLKTFTIDKTVVATRPTAKYDLPNGTPETEIGVLTYLQSLSGLSSLTHDKVEWTTLEFHDILGGRVGSVVVKEVTADEVAKPELFVNCNVKASDLIDMTNLDNISIETATCIDGMTGEMTETTVFKVAPKLTI